MRMTVVYPDGASFVGNRKWWYPFRESKGTHHFLVESSKEPEFKELIGRKVAVPLESARYFVLGGE